jgi:hypothetical protein
MGLTTPAHALFTGSLPAGKCLRGKVGCIAKARLCLVKCHVEALRTATAADAACLAKCRDRFEADHDVASGGCFTKQEHAGDCGPSVGDAGTFAARIDADVQELARRINPTGGPIGNDCAARKLGCVSKYDQCVLTAVRKATKAGTAIGDLAKCTRILDGSDTSCVGKLERKYCDPAAPGCTSSRPPCLTRDDQIPLRNRDDAFVDDVIEALAIGGADVDTQRCSDDTSVRCTSAPGGLAGCGGPLGACEFFAGPPQPISSGGLAWCQLTRWTGGFAGTFDEATGALVGSAAMSTRTYWGTTAAQPCPVCTGDVFANDGAADGVCFGGPRNGLACDVNGRSSQPSFGSTSLDCPPYPLGLVDASVVRLASGNDGSVAKTVTADSPNCNDAPGKTCLCASCSLDSTIACGSHAECASASAGTCTNNAGSPRRPNWCVDTTATPEDGSLCGPDGACPEGPIETTCAGEPFRTCLIDANCPLPNDRCVARPRACFAGYDGNVGDTITATGTAERARNGAAATTIGALACRPATSSTWLNSASGYPGPVRWEVDGVVANDAGPGCPTRLSFVPTSKGPALDLGWTGIYHDQTTIGGTTVTVATTCTGTHPSCACTYAGPIPNPNAP